MKFDIIVTIILVAFIALMLKYDNPYLNFIAMFGVFFGIMAVGSNERLVKDSKIVKFLNSIFK